MNSRNNRVCICVGHGKSENGGYDPGAVSGGYHEFEIAKEIAKLTAEEIRKSGIGCDLINADGGLYLTERISSANAGGYALAVEVHLNAGGGTGTEVYHSKFSSEGKTAAGLVSAAVSQALGVKNRGAKIRLNSKGKDYFAFIRQTTMTAILIETVFIDTPSDLQKVTERDGVKTCAAAIAGAIKNLIDPVPETKLRYEIICHSLTVRSGPSSSYAAVGYMGKGEVVTVTETAGSKWGKIGKGWISLNEKYVRLSRR